MIRSILEKILRPLIYRRSLRTSAGTVKFFVSPSAGLRYLFKPMSQVDPLIVNVAERLVRPGDVIWDIGANIGIFSMTAARMSGASGSVFSFEPDSFLVECLRKSARVQPIDKSAEIHVLPIAISNSVGLSRFVIANRSNATNHLEGYGTTQTGGIRAVNIVPTFSIDWLVESSSVPPPNLVKIDVEGAEVEAIGGALDVLTKFRPILVLEVGAASCEKISDILKRHNYYMYDGHGFSSDSAKIESATWDTVAIPAELSDKYMSGQDYNAIVYL